MRDVVAKWGGWWGKSTCPWSMRKDSRKKRPPEGRSGEKLQDESFSTSWFRGLAVVTSLQKKSSSTRCKAGAHPGIASEELLRQSKKFGHGGPRRELPGGGADWQRLEGTP